MFMLPSMNDSKLPHGYAIRSMSDAEFVPLFEEFGPKLFDEHMTLKMMKVLSEQEIVAAHKLKEKIASRYRLNLGLFHEERFVGWSWGHQRSATEFYMESSAVFVEHRRKGLYSALLQEIIRVTANEGFQVISSKHHQTNNAVIIPKLKSGFLITGISIGGYFWNGCLLGLLRKSSSSSLYGSALRAS
jgi:hypothetical protein